ncbi:hypothetical protein [Halalkalicoccus paucihalophilus]|nr:hypothetical protein [Halalkalicoccus paucihalophilus]
MTTPLPVRLGLDRAGTTLPNTRRSSVETGDSVTVVGQPVGTT